MRNFVPMATKTMADSIMCLEFLVYMYMCSTVLRRFPSITPSRSLCPPEVGVYNCITSKRTRWVYASDSGSPVEFIVSWEDDVSEPLAFGTTQLQYL